MSKWKFLFLLLMLISQGCDQKSRETDNVPTPVIVNAEISSSDIYLGDKNAPVTIIEFSDFQCPSCFHFFQLMENLKSEYIDTGKVCFVFRNYPLDSHPEGESAAIVSRCAAEQGKFWEMYRLLFLKEGDFNRSIYMELASEIELNVSQFQECLQNTETVEMIRSNKASYSNLGVNSTPTFIINNEMYKGVPPIEVMKKMINYHLK